MKATPPKARARKQALLNKRELIIQAWERLDRTAIGERELSEIQTWVRDQSGASDESPAAIARVLADEGAELRHPEVIEFDARWREAKIENEAGHFRGLEALLTGKPIRLDKAEALIGKLEKLRQGGDPQTEKERQHGAWFVSQRGHAVANGLPVITVNRTGHEPDWTDITGGIQFWGQSFVAGPQGEVLYLASPDKEENIVVEIDKNRTEEVRRIWPFFRDRRIDAYGDLTKRYRD